MRCIFTMKLYYLVSLHQPIFDTLTVIPTNFLNLIILPALSFFNLFVQSKDGASMRRFYLFSALPDGINFALILANRAVILAKMKEVKWAIEDLRMSIATGKYPSESIHKLYSRLAKAYEHLQQFDLAITSYKMQFDSMKASSSLTKSQKLQMKSDIEKSLALCKKRLATKSFTSLKSNEHNAHSVSFTTYNKPHAQLPNASGRKTSFKMAYINCLP